MEHRDYYQVLGVEKNATARQIKDAYRQLAFQYHPDRNQNQSENAEKMKSVNEAYAVLSDDEKRNEYDGLRHQFGNSAYGRFRQSYTEQDIFNGSDIHHIFEEMARSFGLRGFNDIFRDLHGQGLNSFEFKQPGMRGRGFVFTTRSASGKPGAFKRQLRGRRGGGMGRLSRFLLRQMTGQRLPEKGGDLYDAINIPPRLAVTGGPYAYFNRRRSRKIVITIPPGMKEGQKIRLAGMGEPGRGGGADGDLYIQLKFQRPLIEKLKGLFNSIFHS